MIWIHVKAVCDPPGTHLIISFIDIHDPYRHLHWQLRPSLFFQMQTIPSGLCAPRAWILILTECVFLFIPAFWRLRLRLHLFTFRQRRYFPLPYLHTWRTLGVRWPTKNTLPIVLNAPDKIINNEQPKVRVLASPFCSFYKFVGPNLPNNAKNMDPPLMVRVRLIVHSAGAYSCV